MIFKWCACCDISAILNPNVYSNDDIFSLFSLKMFILSEPSAWVTVGTSNILKADNKYYAAAF